MGDIEPLGDHPVPAWRPNWHLEVIAAKLIAAGALPRLMVAAPGLRSWSEPVISIK
jgi:hypothetical protein